MNLAELLDAAKRRQGSLLKVAEGLGMQQSRLSQWRSGFRRPNAGEIAYLAHCANMPVLETVAEIEAQYDDRFAPIWLEAVGKKKAAADDAAAQVWRRRRDSNP